LTAISRTQTRRKPDGEKVSAARWHLKAIGPGSPEYKEAQELLKEVAK
jgi:hypothetical protein